jgi:hypothetical protein
MYGKQQHSYSEVTGVAAPGSRDLGVAKRIFLMEGKKERKKNLTNFLCSTNFKLLRHTKENSKKSCDFS